VTDPIPQHLASWIDLRWLQLLSAGSNQLRGHPILQTGLPITTASGTHSVSIAQFVTCTWLMMAKRLTAALDFKRTRVWPNRITLGGFLVRGMTVGLVGYGSIGRECARQLKLLGMRVVCLKRDPTVRNHTGYNAWPETGDPQGSIPERWFGPEQIREMFGECDLVVVTVPSTPETENLVGPAEFASLKRGARMIIVSRGGIVQEDALAEALRTGQLAEAVVDCFVHEPLPPDHIFFAVPNLILSPHVSGIYDNFWLVMCGLLAENLRRFGSGLPLLNRINPRLGY
jgi:phosphoglycerate dehydrogenase-like enzyme